MANSSDHFARIVENLKAIISITDLAASLGIKSVGARYFCPRCQPQGGATPDLAPYPQHLHCFKCGWHPDIFALVQEIQTCDFKTAVNFLGENTLNSMTGKRMRHPNIYRRNQLSNECRNQPFSRLPPSNGPWPLDPGQKSNHGRVFGHATELLSNNPKAIEYLRLRGFDFKLVQNFVGFLPQGQWINPRRDVPEGRIVFPHYDYSDPSRIINLYGRAINPTCPKQLGHDHGLGAKGFFSPNPKLALQSETLLVTEGVFDALALHCSCSVVAVGIAAVFGTQSFNFENFPNARRIIFAFDNDLPGITAVKKRALESLLRGIEVSTVPTAAYRSCKDLADSFLHGPLQIDF